MMLTGSVINDHIWDIFYFLYEKFRHFNLLKHTFFLAVKSLETGYIRVFEVDDLKNGVRFKEFFEFRMADLI